MFEENKSIRIIISENSFTVTSLDQFGLPMESTGFDRSKLTHSEKVFIDNIISMSNSMVIDKNIRDDKSNSDRQAD